MKAIALIAVLAAPVSAQDLSGVMLGEVFPEGRAPAKEISTNGIYIIYSWSPSIGLVAYAALDPQKNVHGIHTAIAEDQSGQTPVSVPVLPGITSEKRRGQSLSPVSDQKA